MTGTIYKGTAGKIYTLTNRIGGGGEGEVYAVGEEDNLVLKVYKETPGVDKAEKLRHMTTMVTDELLRFAAWPLDVVYDSGGKLCGFTMRKLHGYLPLHMLFTPMDRKKLFRDKGYNFLVHVARNLAVAFHKIHHAGIIVGDVNEANLLVTDTGMVALIDCDSFQVKNGSRYHYCEVGMLRYTPPELLRRGSFQNMVRTTNTDAFSLATLIFQLLFLGRAPFTGINPGKQDIDEETAIKSHEFAYSLRKTNKRLFPAKNSLELSAMPPALADAFHAAFELDDKRPTAIYWAEELGKMIKDLSPCGVSRLHFFPAKMGRCPWCAFKSEANIHYFLDNVDANIPPQLSNIEQFINGFRLDPLNVPHLYGAYDLAGISAQKIPSGFYRMRYMNFALLVGIIMLLIVFAYISRFYYIITPISIVLFRAWWPARGKLKRELAVRQQTFNKLKAPFDNVVRQHNHPAALKQYNEAVNGLKSTITMLRNLPAEFGQSRRSIEERYYREKFTQYLHQFSIQNHSITGFGPAKKKLIYDQGIRTAGDIFKLTQIKITGIGPKNQQVLFDWQRQIGSGFTYQPDMTVINHNARQALELLGTRRKRLEIDIRVQHNTVSNLRVTIQNTLKTLEQQHQQMHPKVAQAYADLGAFEELMSWRFLKWW
ncbi:MAG TPA: hypothetical protein VGN20_21765 [Mucilaginibacter sp.]|jgi:DNA-binding helix-hairpin-helix protein with protein kinase domain